MGELGTSSVQAASLKSVLKSRKRSVGAFLLSVLVLVCFILSMHSLLWLYFTAFKRP